MTKSEAVALFGGTINGLCAAIGRSRYTVYLWPEDLEQDQVDLIVGAAMRLGRLPATGAQAPDVTT